MIQFGTTIWPKMVDRVTQLNERYFNPIWQLIDRRLHALEQNKATLDDEIEAFQTLGLERVNQVLGPVLTTINNAAEVGFLTAQSNTSATLVVGEQFNLTLLLEYRALFAPAPWIALAREDNADDYAICQLMGFDRDEGVITLKAVDIYGGSGPFSDWIIASMAGSVLAGKLHREGAEAARDLTLEYRDAALVAQGLAVAAKDITLASLVAAGVEGVEDIALFNIADYYTKAQVDAARSGAIAALVDEAPTESNTLKKIADALTASSNQVPIGTVVGAYASPGAGWLPLDGAAYAKSSYPDLHEVIGDLRPWPYVSIGPLSGPDIAPPSGSYSSVVFPDFSYLITGGTFGSEYLAFYDWNDAAPVKLANPATLPTGSVKDLALSSDTTLLAVAHSTSPYVTFYDMTTPATPVKLANPSSLPAANGYGVSLTPDGRYCALATYTGSNALLIYDLISGTPVKLASKPAVQPSNTCWCCRYSPDGAWLAVGHSGSPFLTIYDNTVPSAPVKIANPAVPPVTTVNSIEWSPDSRYLAYTDNSSNKVMYDMTSGAPVVVPFDVAPTQSRIVWVSNTELYFVGSWVEFYRIVDGVVVQQWRQLTTSNLGFPSGLDGLKFTPDGDFAVGFSGGSPYIHITPLEFNKETHFTLYRFTYENQTFNTAVDAPIAYIKGL